MATLEFVRTFLDDLLCITKDDLEDHLEKLKLILQLLQDANLKINDCKSNFCAIETEYHGYILNREGITILSLVLPKSVKDLHRFLDMVQYYRDIWAR
jgi:hypothetical protein